MNWEEFDVVDIFFRLPTSTQVCIMIPILYWLMRISNAEPASNLSWLLEREEEELE